MDDPANSFCNLLDQGGERALRQLNKMVRRARTLENRNRLYFAPKTDPNTFLHVGGEGVDNGGLLHFVGNVTVTRGCSSPTTGHEVVYWSEDGVRARFQVFPRATYAADCLRDSVAQDGEGFVVRAPEHVDVEGNPVVVEVGAGSVVVGLFAKFHANAVADACSKFSVRGDTLWCVERLPAEPDPSFDIALHPVPYAPTGESPNAKVQRAMEAAAANWQEIITEGFPDQGRTVVPALYPSAHNEDGVDHTDEFDVVGIDDLLIVYYADPHLDAYVGETFSYSHLMNDMPVVARSLNPVAFARRPYASIIRWSASRADGLPEDWLVKIAMHEIGHAIFLNYQSRDFNFHGGLWAGGSDGWSGTNGRRAYTAAGGSSFLVPMERGVHWPWKFLSSRTSGGDIMETRINSHAELGAVTRGALRDFGYAVNDDVVAYQPSPPSTGDEPSVMFECSGRGGSFAVRVISN